MALDPVWIPVWVVLLGAIPGTIGAITSLVNMIHISFVKSKISTLEENTNSKMDRLLAAKDELRASTNSAARAEGHLAGVTDAADAAAADAAEANKAV